ncbi:MAG TPA: IS1595 family transposase [Bacteroidales bacterium]|nr:IS1595 family transposase [Bacteroidales bacterium]
MGRIFKNELTEEQLEELFSSDEKCYEFLAGVKWENGFVCRKCGNTNWCQGKSPHSRRCTKCKSEESAAAGTIFHNCKFPVSKAFYIAYNVCKGKEDLSTYEYARRLSLRQMTCWNFKTRIRHALENIVSIDEGESTPIRKILASRFTH